MPSVSPGSRVRRRYGRLTCQNSLVTDSVDSAGEPINIGVWGSASTGKTTFLASLLGRSGPRLRGIPFGSPSVGHTDQVLWGAWSKIDDQPVLATGGGDGTVRLWDARTHTAIGDPFRIGIEKVLWGAWAQVDGEPLLATGGDGGTVQLWNPRTGQGRAGLIAYPGTTIRWGTWGQIDGRPVLAAGGDGGVVSLWDPRTNDQLGAPFEGHEDSVSWGAWGEIDGQPVLATGGDDGTVRLWDPHVGQVHWSPIPDHTGTVSTGAWGQIDGEPVLAIGASDGMRLWDPRTGAALRASFSHDAMVIQWGTWGHVGGRPVLATRTRDSTVQLWDPTTGDPLGRPLTGHTSLIAWSAWSQIDGQSVLATGGDDMTVRLWDPVTSAPLGEPLTGHTGSVWWGQWGEVDGRPVLATGGFDGTVRWWEVVEDQPVARWSTYRSDVSESPDELARVGDAVALAELITARSARPPLAVGLFGDWGEGKSHFLSLLKDRVHATAQPDNPLAHNAVRQVWFNAWHYAETDLWASLVSELFAQLARSDDAASEQRSQSRLAAELVARRGLRERLAAARARRDELTTALDRIDTDRSALTDDQRHQLADLGAPDPEALYRKAVRANAVLRETGRGWWRFLRSLRPRNVLAIGALLLVLVAATVAIAWGLPAVSRWVAALPGVATIVALGAVAVRLGKEAKTRASQVWQAAIRLAERQHLRLRTAADVAAAEVTELEREMRDLTAAGQLAGLVIDRAGAYRGQLGVMTLVREDFQRMAKLLAHADDEPDEAGDTLPRIDRIVLYVDDLDRCPPRRVVEMLEAIHLLLAVELFVVVVAVDPRWLLRAIAAHYRELLDTPGPPTTADTQTVDPDDEELWRSTPAQYLEKIFQVVLTLPPLDTSGYQRLLRTLVGTRADQPTPAPESTPPPQEATVQAPSLDPQQTSEPSEDTLFGVPLPAARVVERVDPLTLEPDELTLLDLLGPPLLVTTPRAVKRLANSYGLLTAIRRDQRDQDLGEQYAEDVPYYPYRAGLVLLGALVAYPAFGPALLLHLHHTAGDSTWQSYLDDLNPTKNDTGWTNAADPAMTPVQAQQWQALVHALRQVSADAADLDLPLPEPVSAWQEWIVPVGRLSFPAGRIVNNLDRQRPLADS